MLCSLRAALVQLTGYQKSQKKKQLKNVIPLKFGKTSHGLQGVGGYLPNRCSGTAQGPVILITRQLYTQGGGSQSLH